MRRLISIFLAVLVLVTTFFSALQTSVLAAEELVFNALELWRYEYYYSDGEMKVNDRRGPNTNPSHVSAGIDYSYTKTVGDYMIYRLPDVPAGKYIISIKYRENLENNPNFQVYTTTAFDGTGVDTPVGSPINFHHGLNNLNYTVSTSGAYAIHETSGDLYLKFEAVDLDDHKFAGQGRFMEIKLTPVDEDDEPSVKPDKPVTVDVDEELLDEEVINPAEPETTDKIMVYPMPSIYTSSNTYSLKVDGVEVPVIAYENEYDYSNFSMKTGEEVKIEITVKSEITSYSISPKNLNIAATVSGDKKNAVFHYQPEQLFHSSDK
ncbi:MAG TPA: hypothetical protein GXX17_00145 [Clostridiales bacterium]|nr:hypothetical protein [Clostridiales bacterium]